MAWRSIRPPTADELLQLPPYQYDPLRENEFRVVHLHPGTGSDELVVSISVQGVSSHGFNAVSYVWGNNERIHRIGAATSIVTRTTRDDGREWISVNTDVPPSAYFMVTDNLRKVLQSIRSEETFVPLWIDSLCINQDDIAEKTSQVNIMHVFYGLATFTIICLTGFELMPAAFKIIKALAAMEAWETEKLPSRLSDVMRFSNSSVFPDSEPVKHDPWHVLMDFFELPWFHRVWIIQEVVISEQPIIFTEHGTMAWETLLAACRVVWRSEMHDDDAGRVHIRIPLNLEEQRQTTRALINALELGPVSEDSDLVKDAGSANHLIYLQMRSRGCHATDPRDHVFALLGIARGHGGHVPKVDYSLSLAEVSRSVMPRKGSSAKSHFGHTVELHETARG
ncbi:hypothetical protein G7Z17_g5371 [Cylindrodendrum hubeiense]|uniref:Heterokaryon incompatibility domain-containing protein n=1 Tax=Cylindrodendrum hubeiense TaxID=595255 RepID=A0A9P5H770_9HYPO|nr:hypothetical protein G7Z17_g5371 [Cylindrodendrum hubeiense]